MLCDLCTMTIIRDTMYRTPPDRHNPRGFIICSACERSIRYATKFPVDEPMCSCGKMSLASCDARLDPCPEKV